MSTLLRCYPGDRVLELLLAVHLGVALLSSVAWLLAWRLGARAALRHLVLYSALFCCLASPAVAWLCSALGLTLFSIPVLREEQGRMANGVQPMEFNDACPPSHPSTDSPPGAEPPLPQLTATNGCACVAVAPAANESPLTSMSFAPGGEPAASLAEAPMSFRGIATGLMFAWAAGAVMMLARLAWKCGCVMQLRRSSRPLENEAPKALLKEIGARLGMRQLPLLLVSSRTIVPLAVGFGRPAIILPQHLLGAVSDNELRDILVHEMAHLRRGDQRIAFLQELAGALYWPVVSVHALNRDMRRTREELCDNVVLADRDAISYGETLLHIAKLLVKFRPIRPAIGILGGPGKLERRIARLIDPRRNTMTTTGRKTAFVIMFIFIGLGVLASATRFAASANADSAGRVNGPDGKPLSGARVFICPVSGTSKEAGKVVVRR